MDSQSQIAQIRQGTYKLLIQNLAVGKEEFREISSVSDQLQTEYAGRFLIELIQNANDAAHKGGLHDAEVKIIRSHESLYIANQGKPFEFQEGIKEICAIGLTTKEIGFDVGHKGVGFKSVLEVTKCPHIYSGPNSDGPQMFQYAFRFDANAQAELKSQFQEFASQYLRDYPDDKEAIREQTGTEDVIGAVLHSFEDVAYFKLPIDCHTADQAEDDTDLADLVTDKRDFATIIKLPLRQDDSTQATVEKAFRELSSQKGRIVLFTSAIRSIEVLDKTKGQSAYFIHRRPVQGNSSSLSSPCIDFERVETRVEVPGSDVTQEKIEEQQDWLIARTILGDSGRPEAEKEREEIASLVNNLPDRWEDVRTAQLSLALPLLPVEQLKRDGYYCLTFPTEKPTRFPFYLDGQFYGEFSRQAIEIDDIAYNRYLVEHCAELVWGTVEWLKASKRASFRRLACLCFWHTEPTSGKDQILVKALRDTVERRSVVLNRDGETFQKPEETALCPQEDAQLVEEVFGQDILNRWGLRLPDEALLNNCEEALQQLVPEENEDLRLPGSMFLRRSDGSSLLETAARKHRDSGQQWWTTFISFLHNKFEPDSAVDSLGSQCILPVVGKKAATARLSPAKVGGQHKVFRAPRGLSVEEIEDESESAEEELSEMPTIPECLNDQLAFLDEDSIPMLERREGGRRITHAAEFLSPRGASNQLVRLSSTTTFMNNVIIPFFQTSKQHDISERDNELWQTLEFAYRLVQSSKKGAELANVKWSQMLLPVYLPDGTQTWECASNVYLGSDWSSSTEAHGIEEVFRGIDSISFLRPWDEFLEGFSRIGATGWQGHKQDFFDFFFRRVGVLDRPKILRWQHSLEPAGDAFRRQTPDPPKDHPLFKKYWEEYWSHLTGLRHDYPTVHDPYNGIILYIEGCLEIQESQREDFFRLLVDHANYYRRSTRAHFRKKWGASDEVVTDAFWLYALKQERSVPCYRAQEVDQDTRADGISLAKPETVWVLEKGQIRAARSTRYQFLSYLPPEYAEANHNFLKKLGIHIYDNQALDELEGLLRDLTELAKEAELSRQQEDSLLKLAAECWEQIGETAQEDRIGAAKTIKKIIDEGVLVETGSKGAKCLPCDSATVYINDDADRFRYFSQKKDIAFLPLQAARRDIEPWRRKLARILTDKWPDIFRRLSDTADRPSFRPHAADGGVPLESYLQDEVFPGVRIWEHLLSLYCSAGLNPVDPAKNAFQETLDALTNVFVIRGRFEDEGWDQPVFLDYPNDGDMRNLLVEDDSAKPADILLALVPLLGTVSEETMELYATKVKRHVAENADVQAADSFVASYADKGLRREIRERVHAEEYEHLELWKPLAFAARLSRTDHAEEEPEYDDLISELEKEWEEFERDVEGKSREEIASQIALRYLQWPEAEDLLMATRAYDDPDTIKAWAGAGVSPDLIHECLLACGKNGLRFPENRECFREQRKGLKAAIMSASAVLVPNSDLLRNYNQVIDALDSVTPSEEILSDPFLSVMTVREAISRQLKNMLPETIPIESLDIVSRLLGTRSGEQHFQDLTRTLFPRVPNRVFDEYVASPREIRERKATNLWRDYSSVIRTVLEAKGEAAEEVMESVQSDIACFMEGRWANRYVILNRIGGAITRHTDKWPTSHNQELFRIQRKSTELNKWLIEKGYREKKVSDETEPPETITVLGGELTEEQLDQEEGKGDHGSIWEIIMGAATKDDLDISSLMEGHRQEAPDRGTGGGSGGTGGGHGGGGSTSRISDERIGAYGELYVYRFLKNEMVERDGAEENVEWESKAQERFGMGPGDDSLGYDIRVRDVCGLLGQPQRTCFIEVKSTTGSADTPFQMSIEEWEKAEECHRAHDRCYIIARVAKVNDPDEIYIDAMLKDPCEQRKAGILRADTSGFRMWYGEKKKQEGGRAK